ncbi:MAG: hypothetical protein Q8O34_00815 [Rhodocyclaceae bacterium]|nr:hypothetical protein [Rhodocyclaceae bacterium]
MTAITKEERASLNTLALRGQLSVAQCTERLLMDGETVLTVLIAGAGARIDILPPRQANPLWRDCVTYRITPADITFIAVRFGCEIRWTLTRAEAELLRIADIAGRVH